MPATLIVGLGGIGQKIVQRISRLIEEDNVKDVELVVMDTDVNDLRRTKQAFPRIYRVRTSPHGTVGGALDQNAFARDRWFPINDGLMGKPFTEGAGQVRAVSRLALDQAIERGYMSELEKAIEKLHSLSGETMRQEMRVMLVGSNNGGTGSGLVLPVAMYIRNFLITRYQDNSAIIRGFFLEPDTIFDRILDEEERNNLRCNAYATIRELDAFFRKEYSGESDEYKKVVFNAPQPGSGERVDYPNILPYHFVFLMAAINYEGEHLPSHDAYLDHAAETIFAQALSAVSSRSNSSEDNIIRNLAANNGRSRYCGAGSSYLEYPVKDVQRYIGLNWAVENISEEWLELDEQFDKLRRDDEDLKIEEFYKSSFESLMDTRPFYRKLGKNSVFTEIEGEGGQIIREWPANEFPEEVISHAERAVDMEIARHCNDLQHARIQFTRVVIPTTQEGVDDLISNDGEEAADALFQRYYELCCRYNSAIEGEVVEKAKRLAGQAYTVSDFNANPLESNGASWQVESLIRKEEGGVIGAKHPSAVRYLLYSAKIALNEAIVECDNAVQSSRRAINSFISQQENEEEKSLSGFDDDGASKKGKKNKPKLKIPVFGGSSVDEATSSQLLGLADSLGRFKKNIDKRLQNTVSRAYLGAALTYVEQLLDAYEGFYGDLKGKIGDLQDEVNSIEENPKYRNDADGQTHRYVCASTKCLKSMKDDCPMDGDSAALPASLCARIYNRLLMYTKLRDDERSNAVRRQALNDVFEEAIVGYWIGRVTDPKLRSSHLIDMNIAQAIAAEALYLHGEAFAKKKEENDYISNYIRSVFDATFHLAAPFIEPPVGEIPRTFQTCAYSDDIFDNIGGYSNALREKLNEYNGIVPENGDYSKYSIMFYRSMYGFCASNLPKYAPARGTMQPMPEGEYHHAYYMLVDQLSPNLKENSLITPHIDKNWHLVDFLPELNDDFEADLRKETVHAYIFGLIYQQFKARQVSTGADVYYLTSTARQRETNLWVSNGTPCDKFYEVFDAMKFNPRAAKMLLGRSAEELRRETNDSRGGNTVGQCKLVKNVRSEAFQKEWGDDTVRDEVGKTIKDILSLKSEKRDAKQLDGLDTSLVTDFFGLGDQEFESYGWYYENEDASTVEEQVEPKRRSLLEVPLYYRISLPQSETHVGEVDTMVESIFSIVRDHLANFCNEEDLDDQSGQFFEDQYLLFEQNLVDIERKYPGIAKNPVINTIREKTLSYFEPVDARFERIKMAQVGIEKAWRSIR